MLYIFSQFQLVPVFLITANNKIRFVFQNRISTQY